MSTFKLRPKEVPPNFVLVKNPNLTMQDIYEVSPWICVLSTWSTGLYRYELVNTRRITHVGSVISYSAIAYKLIDDHSCEFLDALREGGDNPFDFKMHSLECYPKLGEDTLLDIIYRDGTVKLGWPALRDSSYGGYSTTPFNWGGENLLNGLDAGRLIYAYRISQEQEYRFNSWHTNPGSRPLGREDVVEAILRGHEHSCIAKAGDLTWVLGGGNGDVLCFKRLNHDQLQAFINNGTNPTTSSAYSDFS